MKLLDKYRQISEPVKASVWFLFCSVLQKGIAMLTTPIFTRIMTDAAYGRFTVYNSWYNIFFAIVTLNLAAGVSYEGYNGIICSPLVLGKIPEKTPDFILADFSDRETASAWLENSSGTSNKGSIAQSGGKDGGSYYNASWFYGSVGEAYLASRNFENPIQNYPGTLRRADDKLCRAGSKTFQAEPV